MQTLGLASEVKPTDGLLKRLFWPTIENEYDVDLVRQQGFWLCTVLAGVSVLALLFAGPIWFALGVGLTYFLAATGVREGSIGASAAVFICYLADHLISFVLVAKGVGNPILFFVILGLLLSNIRATILTRRWRGQVGEERNTENAERSRETVKDRFVNTVPPAVWPRGQYVFYPLACALLLLTGVGAVRLAKQQKRMEEIRLQQRGMEIRLQDQ